MQFPRFFLVLLVAYGAASLLHFAHNAEYCADYPNLPAWLSRNKVYLTWLGITAIGIVGYVLVRLGYQITGLLVIAVYAALGFDGLGHYGLAPISAHTSMMNLTIWIEVVAAALLLIATASIGATHARSRLRGKHAT